MPGIMWKVKSDDDDKENDDDNDDNDNADDDPCPGMWLMLQQDKPDDFVLATGHMHSGREFVEVIIVITLMAMIIIKFILTIIILIRITLHQVLNFLQLIINLHQAACEYIGMELEWEGSGDSEIAKEKKTGIVRLSHHCLTIVKLKTLENRRLS